MKQLPATCTAGSAAGAANYLLIPATCRTRENEITVQDVSRLRLGLGIRWQGKRQREGDLDLNLVELLAGHLVGNQIHLEAARLEEGAGIGSSSCQER